MRFQEKKKKTKQKGTEIDADTISTHQSKDSDRHIIDLALRLEILRKISSKMNFLEKIPERNDFHLLMMMRMGCQTTKVYLNQRIQRNAGKESKNRKIEKSKIRNEGEAKRTNERRKKVYRKSESSTNQHVVK